MKKQNIKHVGVSASIKSASGWIRVGKSTFANRSEALVYVQRKFPKEKYHLQGVRVDQTPVSPYEKEDRS